MANICAMMTVMIFFIPGAWPIALLFVLLMAFSRMHNGMHYPSDVLMGSLLGIGY
jgi:membrane-associated phospholipid phosphatase